MEPALPAFLGRHGRTVIALLALLLVLRPCGAHRALPQQESGLTPAQQHPHVVQASLATTTQPLPVSEVNTPFEKMASLVLPYGYTLAEHFIPTVDGYVLRLFRMGHPDAPHPAEGHRPVVHVQHGLLGSSSDFCLQGPNASLPFILVDAGYDVWLGNVRGNTYSRNHTHLAVLDPRFWAFSWDDMAMKDLPAMLLYELDVTGAPSLGYVGHSQGTTTALALLSSQTAVTKHINVAVLLAPVAFATHIDSIPLVTLAQLNTDEIFALLGFHEFLPSVEILSRLEGELCTQAPQLCVSMLSALCGYNPANLDPALLPKIVTYTPSGTSVQNMAHWSQSMRERDPSVMLAYDYGTRCHTVLDLPRPCNQKVYGQDTPPAYNLSAITTPLGLFTGGADKLSDPLDVALLLAALPHHHVWMWHDEPDYEHLDFIWGINAQQRLYGKVLQLLQKGAAGLDSRQQGVMLPGRRRSRQQPSRPKQQQRWRSGSQQHNSMHVQQLSKRYSWKAAPST